jgi:uncharacterized membrane protein
MTGLSTWIIGAFVAVIGLLGLIVAAQAVDSAMYVAGLLFFLFGALFDFWLIKRAFDGG